MASVQVGRYPSTSGPELAVCYGGQQLASATTNHPAGEYTITSVGAWLGNYSGTAKVRLVVFYNATDRPGGVAGWTVPITLDTGYTGGGGGKRYTANLVSPVTIPAGHKVWLGLVVVNGDAGVAMVGKGDITETNENLYRKAVSGDLPVDGVGSTVLNEGQLMIYATGETGGGSGGGSNSLPFAPELISVGTLPEGDLTPNLKIRHLDPDGDASSSARIQVRRVGQTELLWNHSFPVVVPDNGIITVDYNSENGLAFATTYQLRAQTTDSAGNVSPYSDWLNFIIQSANRAPLPPQSVKPDGNILDGNLKPLMQMRHSDLDENSATRARFEVQRVSDGVEMEDVTWTTSTPHGSTISKWYTKDNLRYYVPYRIRGYTFDGKVWSQPSAWTTFELYHVNQAPRDPIVKAPFPETLQKPSDLTEFRWVFADDDALLPGMSNWEGTSTVEIRITEKATGNNFYTVGPITPAIRRHGEEVAITYPSTAPDPEFNKTYNVYYIQRDRRGAANSVVRTMRFSPGGKVAKPTQPSGRITTHSNLGQIKAVYTDTAGAAATEVQVRLVMDDEEETQTAYTTLRPMAVSSGGTITLNWTDLVWLGGSGTIPFGATRGVQVRVRYGPQNLISDWSPSSWVTGNIGPGVPDPNSPANGAAFSTKPILVTVVNDKDQSPSALVTTYQIATDEQFNNVIATTTGTFKLGNQLPGYNGRFEYDTTPVSLVLGTEYYWRATAFDGFLYSGNTTSIASASWSTARRFVYANVPGVSITSPSSIATMRPMITWTSTQAQERYEVVIRNAEGEIVYDSGEVVSPVTQHQVTTSGWVDSHEWDNNETLYVTVSVKNVLWGDSDPLGVTLVYVYPDTPTSVVAEAITPAGHLGTTVVRVSHDPTWYSASEFEVYRYYRVAISGPGGTDEPNSRVLLTESNNPSSTSMYDWTVESGQWYRWEVSQVVLNGIDPIESLLATTEAMAQWDGVIIHLPYQPSLYNIHLRLGRDNAGVSTRRQTSTNMLSSINATKRVAAVGKRHDIDVSGEFTIADDDIVGTLGKDQANRMIDLIDAASGHNSPDGRPHAVCWRSGRGRRGSIVFGVFGSDTTIQEDWKYRNVWRVQVRVEDVQFVLGEAI